MKKVFMGSNEKLKKCDIMLKKKKNLLKAKKSFLTKKGKRKSIALTFDDGPHPKYTPKILDILNEYDVKATFFLVGKRARQNPAIVRRIFKEGHDIGNHTYSHPISPVIKHKLIEKEIKLTGKIVERITGKQPRLFRPTWGNWDMNSAKMTQTAKQLDYVPVKWSISSVDWLGIAKVIEYRILNNSLGSREILLFHDGVEKSAVKSRRATLKVLPKILRCYKDYRFFKLSDFFLF